MQPRDVLSFRDGWKIDAVRTNRLSHGRSFGATDFGQKTAERLGRAGPTHELGGERTETDEQRADRLVAEWLAEQGWSGEELLGWPKGDRRKASMAVRLPAGKRR